MNKNVPLVYDGVSWVAAQGQYPFWIKPLFRQVVLPYNMALPEKFTYTHENDLRLWRIA